MKYLIFVFIVGVILFAFWSLYRGGQKFQNGFQKYFTLKTDEVVMEEWQIYITPQRMSEESDLYRFFGVGGVFILLKTNRARLILKHGNQAFVFDQNNWPVFEETPKKANLHLFTRVSEARVLMVPVPNEDFEMEWHVPRELRVVSE